MKTLRLRVVRCFEQGHGTGGRVGKQDSAAVF